MTSERLESLRITKRLRRIPAFVDEKSLGNMHKMPGILNISDGRSPKQF